MKINYITKFILLYRYLNCYLINYTISNMISHNIYD